MHEPQVRLVQHQYEDVELGEGPGVGPAGTKEQSFKESWVEEEGAGLPKGWQRLQDDAQREYYWHTPTGRTQYSPPGTAGKVSTLTPGLSRGFPGTHRLDTRTARKGFLLTPRLS